SVKFILRPTGVDAGSSPARAAAGGNWLCFAKFMFGPRAGEGETRIVRFMRIICGGRAPPSRGGRLAWRGRCFIVAPYPPAVSAIMQEASVLATRASIEVAIGEALVASGKLTAAGLDRALNLRGAGNEHFLALLTKLGLV